VQVSRRDLEGLYLPAALKVIQPYRVVSANGEAQVKCLELRVTLLKGLYGAREACSSILTLTGQREPAVEHQGGVSCSAQMTEGAVEVTVTGLRAADTDSYRCDIEIFFPPPYRRLTGNGTLVHVLGGTARTETFLSHSQSHSPISFLSTEKGNYHLLVYRCVFLFAGPTVGTRAEGGSRTGTCCCTSMLTLCMKHPLSKPPPPKPRNTGVSIDHVMKYHLCFD
uniref:Immunoglobulin V-set domain-containing protein n=1 Tax=Cyclopterus lumpus TaxID=8103 RepID=A0A8C2XB00_CYCLU